MEFSSGQSQGDTVLGSIKPSNGFAQPRRDGSILADSATTSWLSVLGMMMKGDFSFPNTVVEYHLVEHLRPKVLKWACKQVLPRSRPVSSSA
jgi:hypothetical protein